MNFSAYIGHATIYLVECLLVVGLQLRLQLGLGYFWFRCSVWVVSGYAYVFLLFFLLSLSLSPPTHTFIHTQLGGGRDHHAPRRGTPLPADAVPDNLCVTRPRRVDGDSDFRRLSRCTSRYVTSISRCLLEPVTKREQHFPELSAGRFSPPSPTYQITDPTQPNPLSDEIIDPTHTPTQRKPPIHQTAIGLP